MTKSELKSTVSHIALMAADSKSISKKTTKEETPEGTVHFKTPLIRKTRR